MGYDVNDASFYQGVGCSHCNQTGHRGRIGVYELLEMDDALGEALHKNDPVLFARTARATPTYRPLALAALDLAQRGVTSLREVFRLAEELEEEDGGAEPDDAVIVAEAAG